MENELLLLSYFRKRSSWNNLKYGKIINLEHMENDLLQTDHEDPLFIFFLICWIFWFW